MIHSSRRAPIILALFAVVAVMLWHFPSAQAYDTIKIVLPAVTDRSGYNSPELNTALRNKLSTQFRFPKYEILLTGAMDGAADRVALERICREKDADGVSVLEINSLRNRTWLYNEELFDETNLVLTLSYFDKRTGRYGQFKANRSTTQEASIYSGAMAESLDALDELLNRLDAVFPRQFPGPRY